MRIRKLENRVTALEVQVNNVTNKVDALSTKVDMFIDEMREQNKQRAAEITELDKKIVKMQEQTDAKFSKIEEKLEDMGKHVRNMAVTAIVGVVAIGAAVIGIAYSVITR